MPESASSRFDREFLRAVLGLAGKAEVDHLLFISDYPLSADELRGRSLRRKLIYAVTSDNLAQHLRDDGFQAVVIPSYEYSRMERIKVALVSAASLLRDGETVLALTGHKKALDTLVRVQVGGPQAAGEVSAESLRLPKQFDKQVVSQVLALALAVGQEGFEGHPVGTILVLGDSIAVLEKSKQLTINPFQGLSEGERNVLDPKIREAVRNFSVLDGAFVIREDGVVLAAGRYLQSSGGEDARIPLGLGARHAAAALMTVTTKAIALVVSQTSGTVRIFRGGDIIFELHQTQRRI